MDIYDLLLKDVPIPRFVCARYQVKAGDIRREDIPLLVRERIARRGVLKPIRPGDTVAVAAGSRGIHNYDAVVRAVVVELIAAGARRSSSRPWAATAAPPRRGSARCWPDTASSRKPWRAGGFLHGNHPDWHNRRWHSGAHRQLRRQGRLDRAG